MLYHASLNRQVICLSSGGNWHDLIWFKTIGARYTRTIACHLLKVITDPFTSCKLKDVSMAHWPILTCKPTINEFVKLTNCFTTRPQSRAVPKSKQMKFHTSFRHAHRIHGHWAINDFYWYGTKVNVTNFKKLEYVHPHARSTSSVERQD